MAPKTIDIREFVGVNFDPETMNVTVYYRATGAAREIRQLVFPLIASDNLIGWLVQLLERLSERSDLSVRLRALKRPRDPKKH